VDFRKTYFILPNLFTLASVFCGLYSIVLTARLGEHGGVSDDDLLYKASLAIVLGLLFDGADGRIARLTKTQSDLGVQLDSLADVITFGVAPSILVYRWGLLELGNAGLFIAFVFCACGALRLARFNVLAMREQQAKLAAATQPEPPGDGKPKPAQFIGLPIPIAANMIVALVLANHAIGVTEISNHAAIAAFVLVLSYLMISRVRFRSFKDVTLNKRRRRRGDHRIRRADLRAHQRAGRVDHAAELVRAARARRRGRVLSPSAARGAGGKARGRAR
jgi:CDP-diacylglycerol--serine O-phosphatidyltransferase